MRSELVGGGAQREKGKALGNGGENERYGSRKEVGGGVFNRGRRKSVFMKKNI